MAIGIGGLLYDNFVTGQVLANVLITNSHLIVLAVGMTFVILTGGIDLSVGAVVALSAMIARQADGGRLAGGRGDPRRARSPGRCSGCSSG